MRDFIHVASAIVYVARNKINGKCYIGATEKTLRARARTHISRAKKGRQSIFSSAIRKHGSDAFEWSIIFACRDFFDALEWERMFIRIKNPAYNMTDGGGGVKGLRFSSEARAKMSAAKKGKPNQWSNGQMPSDLRERLATLRRAEAGRKLTQKQLIAMQKNAATANDARRRRVLCVTTGVEYVSVTEAAKAFGLTNSMIGYYCRGRFKSKKGLEFNYLK